MKLLLWVGNESNHKALVNKLSSEFDVIGLVTESRQSKNKITKRKIFNSLFEKLTLSVINDSWSTLKNEYGHQFPAFPNVAHINVENINSIEAYEFSKKLNPDLIIVSGTRLVKKEMLSVPSKKGILNLHTGLSPYVKGGPNCTNWCIATNQFHLIGNTVMWIDEGIDSGNILTTEFTPLENIKSLFDIHKAVMEHAHSLYIKAIKFISIGGESKVPQSQIAQGKTYYTKDWDLKAKKDLVANLKNISDALSNTHLQEKRKTIKVIRI